MKRIIYKALWVILPLLAVYSCKEDPVRIYSKDFKLELTLPESYQRSMVGAEVPLTLSIKDFAPENDGEIQTVFSTNSSGKIRIGEKEIPQGTTYDYDYRSKKMSLDFVYLPSSEGSKTIEVEVRCAGVVRKASVSLIAISPKTTMDFKIPEDPIIPETPISIPLTVYSANENLTITAVFVQGAGKVELDGKVIDSETGVPVHNDRINRLVCTFSKAGEQVIDFTLKGRYGEPQKATLKVVVGVPKWTLTVEKMNPDKRLALNSNHSFIFKIDDQAEGNEFSCKYRFLQGSASLSFHGVDTEPARSFNVGRGSSIALINPKSVGKIEIEFVVTDKFGVEHKDTAVFYTLGGLSLSVSPQTQTALVGDEAKVEVRIAEENYKESFTVKFERLISENSYELVSTRTVSTGTHEFRYTPQATGVVTFRVTATDKHGQSVFEVFTLDARSQKIDITAPKLEYSDDIHQPVYFEVNVSEKAYTGRFWLYWDIDLGEAELKSVDRDIEQDIAPRNYTEIRSGKNRFRFTPHFVGKAPIKLTIKDERNQTTQYNAISFTSSAKIEALATEGGRAEGGKKTSDGVSQHSITAIPNHGYDFAHWYKTSDRNKYPVSTSKTYSFVVRDNVSYTALFQLKEFIIKVLATTGGSVAFEGYTSLYRSMQYGSSATVVATPNSGYDFSGWYNKGRKLSSQLRYNFVVNDAADLEARFTKQKMNLNISSMAGGTVRYSSTTQKSHHANLDYGTSVSLEAYPEATYAFVGWYEGNRLVSSSVSYNFNIEKHTNLEARFRKLIYTVRTKVFPRDEAGSVRMNSSNGVYNHGDNVSLTVNPNQKHLAGYEFEGWKVDGRIMSRSTSYSFVAEDDKEVIASFTPKKYSVKIKYAGIPGHYGLASATTSAVYGEPIDVRTYPETDEVYYSIEITSGSEHTSNNEQYDYGVRTASLICRGETTVTIWANSKRERPY